MKRLSRDVLAPIALSLFASLPVAQQAQATDWAWSITPYFWGSDMQLEVQINDQEVIDEKVDLSQLIDKLEFIFAGRFEGRNGKNGFFGDIYFADFGDDDKSFDLAGSVPGEILASPNLEFTILEAGGLYNPKGDGNGMSVLYGVRMFDIDLEIDASYQFDSGSTVDRNYHTSEVLWDALIGVRYIGEFGDRWLYDFKVDASAAGTDLTWTAMAGVGWAYGKDRQHAIVVGYRYMDIDLGKQTDRGVDIDSEIEMAGFYGAFKFGF